MFEVEKEDYLMCLAIPMRVLDVSDLTACCEAKGVTREVSLFMLQHEEIAKGDMVMVHVGYAIQKVDEEQAAATWELLDEVLERIEATGVENA